MNCISTLLYKLYHPEIFQGTNRKKNYFEGWYFKIIDSERNNSIAIIPGIAVGDNKNDCHAFIQVLMVNQNTMAHDSVYIKYSIDRFKYNDKKFEISIGDSYFNRHGIHLNIKEQGCNICGNLSFINTVEYPSTMLSPNIMGPFHFVPFMECYHSIINIHHETIGSINISDKSYCFDNGYGYIEKDWGTSFPEAWIWLQSNHFDKSDITFMFSAAKIPFLSKFFMGYISFLRIGKQIYKFSTYTKAKITDIINEDNKLSIVLKDKRHVLYFYVVYKDSGVLKAPHKGKMNRDIKESINATIYIKLTDKQNKILFEGEGTNTGLEIVENIFKYI